MLMRRIPSTGESLPAIGLGTSGPFEVGADASARAPLREVLQALNPEIRDIVGLIESDFEYFKTTRVYKLYDHAKDAKELTSRFDNYVEQRYGFGVPNVMERLRNDALKWNAAMPRFAANLTMMFTEVPFLDRFEAAARQGFTTVEYFSPYEFSAVEIVDRLRRKRARRSRACAR